MKNVFHKLFRNSLWKSFSIIGLWKMFSLNDLRKRFSVTNQVFLKKFSYKKYFPKILSKIFSTIKKKNTPSVERQNTYFITMRHDIKPKPPNQIKQIHQIIHTFKSNKYFTKISIQKRRLTYQNISCAPSFSVAALLLRITLLLRLSLHRYYPSMSCRW